MSFEFSAPTQGQSLKPADVQGHLLIVEPSEFTAGVPTAFGESDAIRCTVHDINDAETYEDILWFSTVLVSSLKSRIGQRVLGVMGQGVARPGQSAPWILVDASGEQAAVTAATAYLESRAASSFTAPSPEPVAAPAASGQSPELAAALAKFGKQ